MILSPKMLLCYLQESLPFIKGVFLDIIYNISLGVLILDYIL